MVAKTNQAKKGAKKPAFVPEYDEELMRLSEAAQAEVIRQHGGRPPTEEEVEAYVRLCRFG